MARACHGCRLTAARKCNLGRRRWSSLGKGDLLGFGGQLQPSEGPSWHALAVGSICLELEGDVVLAASGHRQAVANADRGGSLNSHVRAEHHAASVAVLAVAVGLEVASGSDARSPVSRSVQVTTQRSQWVARTRRRPGLWRVRANPRRRRRGLRPRCWGGMLGRNRFIGTGVSRRALRSVNEAFEGR